MLKHADGSTLNIAPAQVKARTVAPSSMPEIYGQMLSRTDLRDLIAVAARFDRRADDASEKFGDSNRAMSAVTAPAKEGGHP